MANAIGYYFMGIAAVVWLLIAAMQFESGDATIAAISAASGLLFALAFLWGIRGDADE